MRSAKHVFILCSWSQAQKQLPPPVAVKLFKNFFCYHNSTSHIRNRNAKLNIFNILKEDCSTIRKITYSEEQTNKNCLQV